MPSKNDSYYSAEYKRFTADKARRKNIASQLKAQESEDEDEDDEAPASKKRKSSSTQAVKKSKAVTQSAKPSSGRKVNIVIASDTH